MGPGIGGMCSFQVGKACESMKREGTLVSFSLRGTWRSRELAKTKKEKEGGKKSNSGLLTTEGAVWS